MTAPRLHPRRRRTTIVVLAACGAALVLGVAAVAFGPAIYRDVIVGAAPPAPSLSPGAPPAAGASDATAVPLTDLSGSWHASPGSYAGYRVDEVLNGTDVTVVGRTETVTAEIHVDGLAVTDALITVDVASIATDEPARDGYFRDTALRVSEHPTATFRLTEPLRAERAPAAGQTATVEVAGELTVRGVTRAATAEMQSAFDGRTVQVAGSIPITFADYGVEAPNLGFVSVEPEGFVEFLLVLDKVS
ncbi:YceI family protein [Microbacterium sp. NPDC096154]|uniref:YceI family protein n=1 Tax=Microbacterium sp. NPDC096154 TaxID=3155549 RepID=UPI00331BCA9B